MREDVFMSESADNISSAPDSSGSPGSEGDARLRSDRDRQPRRLRFWLILVGVIIVLAIAAVLIWQGVEEPEEPVTPPPVTITNALPTPQITPISKEPGSAFYDLLPATVLQYALTATDPDASDDVVRALEAFTLTYSDGADHSITVTASQWESVEDAVKNVERLDQLASEVDPDAALTHAPVEVDGEEVGTASLRLGETEGRVTWSNGTSVLTAVGPAADIENFFTAFPI